MGAPDLLHKPPINWGPFCLEINSRVFDYKGGTGPGRDLQLHQQQGERLRQQIEHLLSGKWARSVLFFTACFPADCLTTFFYPTIYWMQLWFLDCSSFCLSQYLFSWVKAV